MSLCPFEACGVHPVHSPVCVLIHSLRKLLFTQHLVCGEYCTGIGDSEMNKTQSLPRRNSWPNVGEKHMCKELQLRVVSSTVKIFAKEWRQESIS